MVTMRKYLVLAMRLVRHDDDDNNDDDDDDDDDDGRSTSERTNKRDVPIGQTEPR